MSTRSKVFPDTHHATVRISVTDTGIGMTADQISGLFQAFAQAERIHDSQVRGTGLGVALSQNS